MRDPAAAGRGASTLGSEPTPYNATVDLLERNVGGARGSRPYLVTEDRRWSYAEVSAAADAAGAGLRALGLEPGDRVILGTRDRPEFVMTFWGAMKAGLVPVPIAQGLSSSDLHFIFTDSEAGVVVCDLPSSPAVVPAAARAGVACLLVGPSRREDTRSWEEVCGRPSDALSPESTTTEDIALWLYTSGTTGLPKAVMHRHRHLRDAPAGLSHQVLDMGSDDLVQSVSKMFFAYGLGNSVYLPAAAGASVLVDEGPAIPARMDALMHRMRPTLLFGVPAFFDGLSRQQEARLPSSIRMVLSAGEALSQEVFRRFSKRFGRPPLDGLGSTEALHHVTCNQPDDVVPGSAGRPLAGFEAMLFDRDHQPLPEGERGELWIRGPTTFAGYWRRPELSAAAYRDSWMRTGDLVRMVDGRVFHEGRIDDLIKLGGLWVAPREIEDVLRGHPSVSDAAVVTVDDGSGIPVLRAVVLSERTDDGLTRELRRLCRHRLASFKVPKSFEVVSELPRTPTGKIKRFVLRDRPSPRPRRVQG